MVGARKTSERLKIWLADALLSSIDCIAAEDSVPGPNELVADSDESCGFADKGDLSPGRLIDCFS